MRLASTPRAPRWPRRDGAEPRTVTPQARPKIVVRRGLLLRTHSDYHLPTIP
jgi:hypothetical protein